MINQLCVVLQPAAMALHIEDSIVLAKRAELEQSPESNDGLALSVSND
jgi:hypothetical protein